MLRQALGGGDGLADLELPDDGQLLAEAVLIEGLELDDVIELGAGLISGAAGKALDLDVRYCPGRASDLDDLAGLGQRACRGQRDSSPTCLLGLAQVTAPENIPAR